jgi:hypothetical protein
MSTAHSVGIAGHELRAAVLALGHQLGTFQHGYVLLHSCKRHRITRRQLADGRFGAHHASQDVAPRRIGQRAKQLVERGGRWLSMYNHTVVY